MYDYFNCQLLSSSHFSLADFHQTTPFRPDAGASWQVGRASVPPSCNHPVSGPGSVEPRILRKMPNGARHTGNAATPRVAETPDQVNPHTKANDIRATVIRKHRAGKLRWTHARSCRCTAPGPYQFNSCERMVVLLYRPVFLGTLQRNLAPQAPNLDIPGMPLGCHHAAHPSGTATGHAIR